MRASLRYVLAIAGPAVVLALAFLILAHPTEGREARAMDERARAAAADVVVVGASFAYADLDPERLGAALSPTRAPALVLAVGSSEAAVWYAILQGRVYGNGLDPAWVILPVSLRAMLQATLDLVQTERLADQMPIFDEVVLARSFGTAPPSLGRRVLDRRSSLRDPVLDGFRTFFPVLLFGADADHIRRAGLAYFVTRKPRVGGPGALPVDERPLAAPDESYLADIVRLVTEHGGRLAVVLPPVAPGTTSEGRLDAGREAEVVAWASAHGVRWLDLRDLGWPRARFTDGLHMNADAAAELTDIVAVRLGAEGAPAP